jgi:hypothetical protein
MVVTTLIGVGGAYAALRWFGHRTEADAGGAAAMRDLATVEG